MIDSTLGLSVLFFQYAGTFSSKDATTVLLITDVLNYIIFSKRRSPSTISLTCFNKFQQNTCIIETQNIIFKIYVINLCHRSYTMHILFLILKPKSLSFTCSTHFHSFLFVASLAVIRFHSLSPVVSLVVIHFHSLSLVVIRCTIRCQSLSLVVIRCTNRCHSLSLAVTRRTTCLSFYKRLLIIKFLFLFSVIETITYP